MAIAVVSVSSPVQSGWSTPVAPITSAAWTSTSGNLLVGVVSVDVATAAGATPWADSKSNTWASSKSANVGSDPAFGDIGYAGNIAGGSSHTVTFTSNGDGINGAFLTLYILEASGIATSSPVSVAVAWVTQNQSVSHTLDSSLITPAAGSHLLVVGGNIDATVAIGDTTVSNIGTASATWTVTNSNDSDGLPAYLAYAIVAADGLHSYGARISPDAITANQYSMGAGIGAFKAAVAGAQDTPELYGSPRLAARQMQQLLAQ